MFGALTMLEDAGLLKPGIHLCPKGDCWTKYPTCLITRGPRQHLALAGVILLVVDKPACQT